MLGIRALLFKIGTSGLAGQRVALLPSFMLPAPFGPGAGGAAILTRWDRFGGLT